jgi:hypothetical protein
MNPLEALSLQLRLEGFEIADGNRLRQVEVVPGEEMPLMILAQLVDGQLAVYFDGSLQRNLYLELMKQMQHIQFPEIDPLAEVLNMHNVPFQVGHYKTNLFPVTFMDFIFDNVECRSKNDPQVQKFGFGDFAEHVYVIEREGKVVSACASTREDKRCGEAWVCTDPQYRHHGLARQVVSAWARDMLAARKVPFYSHKISNAASAGLTKRLELLSVFEEIVISYANQRTLQAR